MKQRLKQRITSFCVGLFVVMGFTILGLIIDIKIISKYDHNPYGSFMLYLLFVGLIGGWIVGNRIFRRLVEDVEKHQRA
jgi:hypothetical protein